MTALTFGTFIRLGVSPEETRPSIEAAISVPEGFWAFKYDTIDSLVYATWTPGQPEVSKDAEASNYRLRLWSGSNPQKMALTGFEEIVKFNIDNLPWKHPIPKITLDVCFWFGIERIKAPGSQILVTNHNNSKPTNNSGQEKLSDLIQELERTTRLYNEIEAECAKWGPTIKRFQRAKKAIAEGRGTEWFRKGMEDLQGGVKELRKIVSVSDIEDSQGQACSPRGGWFARSGQTSSKEELTLQNEKLIAKKKELQDKISMLEKETASKDVDINELSETVYRLQCENDILKGESDEDGLVLVTKPQTERTKTDQNPKHSDNSRRDIVRVLAPRGVKHHYTKAIALPYRTSNSTYRRHGSPKISPASNAGITTAVHDQWTMVDRPPGASRGRSVEDRGKTKYTDNPDNFKDASTRLSRRYPRGVSPKRERRFYKV